MLRVRFVSEAVAMSLPARPDAAMISITEPGRFAPLKNAEKWGALLRVQFADAEYDAAMIERLQARGIAFNPDEKGFPSQGVAIEIRAFLDGLKEVELKELVIHCHAGQRRSAAVARYAAETLGGRLVADCDGHNKTVYSLLCEPALYKVATRRKWWQRMLFFNGRK